MDSSGGPKQAHPRPGFVTVDRNKSFSRRPLLENWEQNLNQFPFLEKLGK